MKKKITLKYYGHKYPEQLLMRAANMISAVTPTDALRINPSTKSATIYADPIQARAIAKQIKKSTGVTLIVNLPDNVGRFIDFLVAEGVFAEYVQRHHASAKLLRFFSIPTLTDLWVGGAFTFPDGGEDFWRRISKKWQKALHPRPAPKVWFDECTEITRQQFIALSSNGEKGTNILTNKVQNK